MGTPSHLLVHTSLYEAHPVPDLRLIQRICGSSCLLAPEILIAPAKASPLSQDSVAGKGRLTGMDRTWSIDRLELYSAMPKIESLMFVMGVYVGRQRQRSGRCANLYRILLAAFHP